MNIENNDQSSDDSNEIVYGYFGIEENDFENCTTHSDCEEIEMNIDDKTIFNSDSRCKKTTENASYNQVTEPCTEIVESPCFGSHILNSKSKGPNSSDLPSSFAKITDDYEKSIKDISKHAVETSGNGSQVSQLESKSTVVLPKTNFQSLSMISNNYQDSSSESDDLSDADDDKCADSDDNISIISLSSNPKESVKTKGELDINDLPPIQDLKISVDEEKCQPVGCVKSFVDTLVVVEAFLNQPALDIDSVLFLDRGKRALGRIFDVFGPVNKPYYAVRFNNSDHIKKFNVLVKEPVFCAPETEYSSFVLISQLLKMKGSDASWRDNNEPPPECLDYSDDEAEKLAKKKRKQKKKNNEKGKNSNDNGKPPEPPCQNSGNRNRSVSVDTTQRQSSFPPNSNQPSKAYSPRPPNFSACSSNYNNSRPPNFNICRPNINNRPPNINNCPPNINNPPQNINNYPPNINNFPPNLNNCPPNINNPPPNINIRPPNFNIRPPNINIRPPNFHPSVQNYSYDQRPPLLSYAQQLSAMDFNQSYRQPFNPQYYNQSNMYPPSPAFPHHDQQMPPGYSHQPSFPQTNQNNPTLPAHMHYPNK